MSTQKVINVFNDGMQLDIDKLNQPNTSYRYSLNGSLIFNEDGTYSWENEKGNVESFSISANNGLHANLLYVPLGYVSGPNYVILYSYHENLDTSEIGIVCFDKNGIGTYKTLFNDINDPYSGKLSFRPHNQIEAKLVYETDNVIRVYWVDGVKTDSNRPKVFSFSYNNALEKDDVNAYTAETLSTHAMAIQPDFNLGIIKYVRSLTGSLLTGVYQYTYRLGTSDGARTPWYPLTNRLFVTDDGVSSNWHEYEMNGVGINSGKGNRIQIKGIDTRFNLIEVAYVYSQTQFSILEAVIFAIAQISSDTQTFDHLSNDGTPIADPVFEIPQRFSNIQSVKTLEIKDQTLYYGNITEGDLSIDIDDVLSNVSIKPIFRDMRDDEKTTPLFASGGFAENETTSIGSNLLPLTNQTPKTGTTTRQLHNDVGGTEQYTINNDYINYKGTQVEHLYKGYFRGETYRFGIVFFDEIGQPGFVYHLCDMQFPNFSEVEYEWQRLKGDGTIEIYNSNIEGTNLDSTSRAWQTTGYNSYTDANPIYDSENLSERHYSLLRIMGIEVSGIDLTSIKNKIKGFKIVRCDRDGQILHQGIILPCVRDILSGQERTRPLITPTQHWRDNARAFNGNTDTDIVYGSNSGDIELLGCDQTYGKTIDTVNDTVNTYLLRPNISVYYSPYLYYTEEKIQRQEIDRIKLVGNVWGDTDPVLNGDMTTTGQENIGYNQFFTHQVGGDGNDLNGEDNKTEHHSIQKLYYSRNTFHTQKNYFTDDDLSTKERFYPVFNDEATIEQIYNLDFAEEIEDYETNLDLINRLEFDKGKRIGFYKNLNFRSIGRNNTVFIKHGNFGNVPSPFSKSTLSGRPLNTATSGWDNAGSSYVPRYNSMFVANYIRLNPTPYGGLTNISLEQSRFETTGHFQPVNNATFNCPDIVNGIQVFGGDCYLNYVDFVRAYPDIDLISNNELGYAVAPMGQSIVFPLESTINHALRQRPSDQEPSLANNGLKPHGTVENVGPFYDNVFQNGLFTSRDFSTTPPTINTELLEEWDYQKVLFFDERIRFYTTEPFLFNPGNRFPVRWRYSELKIYGDPIDNFRKFLAFNFRDSDGRFGDIMASSFLMDNIYFLQEEAFGRLRAYERALLQDQNGRNLVTGTGERLDGEDYISTVYGTQHQWSLANSGKSLYWVDSNKRKLMRFAGDGLVQLSDVRGAHQFFNKILPEYKNADNPTNVKGIVSNYDHKNEMVYVTFTSNDKDNPELNSIHTTISFNENLDKFISYHSYIPTFYISTRLHMLSYDLHSVNTVLNTFYLHEAGLRGRFYGVDYPSKLDVIVQENNMLHKVFDNLRMNINNGGSQIFDALTMVTETQSETLNITSDNRPAYKEDVLRLPLRTLEQLDRMRGKHIKLQFNFTNTNDIISRFTNLVTHYRISSRM